MRQIDLNCDLGESYGTKDTNALDSAIMPYLSSCNIACGFHSGDPLTIKRTIEQALQNNVAIGAHPSFPDLQGFGRRMMQMSKEDLYACVLYQVSALKGMAESLGGQMHHIKAHGALYNLACRDRAIAQTIVDVTLSISTDKKIFIYGLPDSEMEKACKEKGIGFKRELFADRCYEDDLSLRSRQLEGAVIEDAALVLKQVKQMVLEQQLTTYKGKTKKIIGDTLCLHSDTKDSLNLAKNIHNLLINNGVKISAL